MAEEQLKAHSTEEKPKGVSGFLTTYLEGMKNPQNAAAAMGLILNVLPSNRYINVVRKFLPAAITSFDLYTRFRSYQKSQEKEQPAHIQKSIQYSLLFGNPWDKDHPIEITHQYPDGFDFPQSMIAWLFTSPKFPEDSSVSLLGYYSLDSGKITDPQACNSVSIVFSVANAHNKLAMTFKSITLSGKLIYSYVETAFVEYNWTHYIKAVQELDHLYQMSLDLESNIMLFGYREAKTRPRVKDVDFHFDNVDYDAILADVNFTLSSGLKKGWVLAGDPGTGKTSILLKMERDLKYPIVYISPSNLESDWKITNLFKFLESVQPCLMVYEDMDTFGLHGKDGKLGTFLNIIDGSKVKLNVAMIATVNNTDLLDSALVRPGRFDEIVDVHQPRKRLHKWRVLNTHWLKTLEGMGEPAEALPESVITWPMYWVLTWYKFSAADLCFLADHLIRSRQIGHSTQSYSALLWQAVRKIRAQRKVIKSYRDKDASGKVTGKSTLTLDG